MSLPCLYMYTCCMSLSLCLLDAGTVSMSYPLSPKVLLNWLGGWAVHYLPVLLVVKMDFQDNQKPLSFRLKCCLSMK